MSSFSSLKRNRGVEKLTKALESTTQSSESNSRDDDRFWQPTADKAGNGMAVIRFLPAPETDGDDALPWVRVFSHGFQGPGGWYIEDCLTTIDGKCPACEHNSTLWNSGIEANKDIVRKQKRRLNYIANVLVVSDPAHPENEGQIKLYKFGKKIFDKLTEAMNPQFEDEKPINPFDFWEGANFKVKIRMVEGYRNYDKSEFADPTELFDGNDEKLEALWKKEYSLKEFTDKEKFKSYDQLKVRLDKALGFENVIPKNRAEEVKLNTFKEEDEDIRDKLRESKIPEVTDVDEDLNFFQSLAEE